jgi:hypothetical protein
MHTARRALDEAIAAYREAASVDEGLVAADPRDGSARRRLLETSEHLCDQLAERGSMATALASCGRRLTLIDNLLRDEPRDITLRNKRIAAAGRLATVLRAAGQLEEARRVESEAERSVREVGRTYPMADPLVGVWRRRPKTLENSCGNMPKHAVRIVRVEPLLNGLSFTYFDDLGETVISFVVPTDGKPAAMFGPGGQRVGTMHARRIDQRHGESWGEGLPYIYERSSISPDGRTWISKARMKAPNGQEFVDVDTWDKEQDIVYSASSKRPPEGRH